jgi:hypothetical protein
MELAVPLPPAPSSRESSPRPLLLHPCIDGAGIAADQAAEMHAPSPASLHRRRRDCSSPDSRDARPLPTTMPPSINGAPPPQNIAAMELAPLVRGCRPPPPTPFHHLSLQPMRKSGDVGWSPGWWSCSYPHLDGPPFPRKPLRSKMRRFFFGGPKDFPSEKTSLSFSVYSLAKWERFK